MENPFARPKIPAMLPSEMVTLIAKLRKSKSKRDCLKKAYEILTGKYRGYRFRTYLFFWRVFKLDLGYLWGMSGFLHCTSMNYLLRVFLIKSGFFSEGDIEQKWVLIWYVSPHQYLHVRIGKNKFVNVDVWNKNYGIGLGDYARGFHNS